MKARYKPFDELPERCKCCTVAIETSKALEMQEIEISDKPIKVTHATRCKGCGHIAEREGNSQFLFAVIGKDYVIGADVIDIDEGNHA